MLFRVVKYKTAKPLLYTVSITRNPKQEGYDREEEFWGGQRSQEQKKRLHILLASDLPLTERQSRCFIHLLTFISMMWQTGLAICQLLTAHYIITYSTFTSQILIQQWANAAKGWKSKSVPGFIASNALTIYRFDTDISNWFFRCIMMPNLFSWGGFYILRQ